MDRLRILLWLALGCLPVLAGCGLAGLGSTAGAAYAVMELTGDEDEDEEPPPALPPLEAAVASSGPLAGRVTALACDDSGAADRLYAGTFRAGIYLSADGGSTWTLSSTGFLRDLTVTDLCVDPATPALVAAATGQPHAGGLYLSEDSGATWTACNAGLAHLDIRALVQPSAGTYYAATGGAGLWVGTYTAASGTVAWTQAATTGLANLHLTDAVVAGSHLFVASAGGGVYYADTSGAAASWSWTAQNAGLPTLDMLTLAAGGAGDLYVGTNGNGVYALDITAAPFGSWSALADPGVPGSSVVRDVAALDGTPDSLFLATQGGVFLSTDAGSSWSQPTTPPAYETSLLRIALHPSTTSTLFLGAYAGGFYASTDSGDTWSASSSGIVATWLDALAVDPGSATDTKVFAGSAVRDTGGSSRGVFVTADSGASWASASDATALQNADIRDLVVDPSDSNIVYAATAGGGVYRSANGGSTWTAVNTGLGSSRVLAFALDPAATSHLFAATDLGIYRSTDSGSFWSAATTQPPAGEATLTLTGVSGIFLQGETVTGSTSGATGDVLAGAGTSTLVVASAAGAFLAGETLTGSASSATATVGTVSFAWSLRRLLVDPAAASTVWAAADGSRGGVYVSTDGGDTWAAAAGQPGSSEVTCLAADTESTTTYYAGTADAGVFRTVDGGATWTEALEGLGAVAVLDLVADDRLAASGTHALFAATARGLFRSADRAATWQEVTDAAPVNPSRPGIRTLRRLGLDPLTGNEKVLWAATGGRGVLRITLP